MNKFYQIACALLALTILVSFYTGKPSSDKDVLVEGQGGTYAAADVESEIALPDVDIESEIETETEVASSKPEKEEPEKKEEETVSSEPSQPEKKEEENISSEPIQKEPENKLPVTPGYQPYMDEDELAMLEFGLPVRLQHTDPATLKFAMQENNPAPVSVNRLKQNLQSVSFAYELLEGEEIEFEATSNFVGNGGGESDRCIIIYDNYEWYKQRGWFQLENLYDDAFFENNAIIGIHYIDRFANVERHIESLTIKDGHLCIYVKNTFMGDKPTYMTTETHIKISKEDLSKIRDVVVYEEKIAIEKDGETVYQVEYIDSGTIYPV